MTRFLLSSNPLSLRAALDLFVRTATVEAEYGDTLVTGTDLTMAHHGPRAGQPAPCSYPNTCIDGYPDAVGLSHFDLDAFAGCLAILGVKPDALGFWLLAEFIDLNGAHKLSASGATPEDIRRLYAFWAWSEKNKLRPPQDGSVADVTDFIDGAITVIVEILDDEPERLKAGDEFKAAGEMLNAETFVELHPEPEGVIVRFGPSFMNHLYVAPDGTVAKAVVSFNTLTGAITVSFADAPKGKNAKDIVQAVFGELAGGHAGIAGSPRGTRCTTTDMKKVLRATKEAIIWHQEVE